MYNLCKWHKHKNTLNRERKKISTEHYYTGKEKKERKKMKVQTTKKKKKIINQPLVFLFTQGFLCARGAQKP